MQKTALPHQELVLSNTSAPLHVVTAIFNPIRYASRYNLYKSFEKYVRDSGAILTTIECAFGNRPFEVTEASNPFHIQVRTYEELWIKENLINIAISRLPTDWEYVAWVDADVQFARPDWVAETVHQLQHYMFIQMFSDAYDLSPGYRVMEKHMGWAYSVLHRGIPNSHEKPKAHPQHPVHPTHPAHPGHPVHPGHAEPGLITGTNTPCYYYQEPGKPGGAAAWYHPGYAWAARREAIDGVGGLMDFPILGAGDHHMAWSLIGEAKRTMPSNINHNYKRLVYQWQENALETIHRDIGYMSGSLLHYWHGNKADRRYKDRWEILIDNDYDPLVDIKRDNQGLLALTKHNHKLRDGIREYFRFRNEDSIDLSHDAKDKLDR